MACRECDWRGFLLALGEKEICQNCDGLPLQESFNKIIEERNSAIKDLEDYISYFEEESKKHNETKNKLLDLKIQYENLKVIVAIKTDENKKLKEEKENTKKGQK